jgi:hypothetical protein
MNVEEWSAITEYDLKPGTLYGLNKKLYKDYKRDALVNLLGRINKKHCPSEVNKDSAKKNKLYIAAKLTLTRLSKIMSGEEYNTHIVHAIMDDLRVEETE